MHAAVVVLKEADTELENLLLEAGAESVTFVKCLSTERLSTASAGEEQDGIEWSNFRTVVVTSARALECGSDYLGRMDGLQHLWVVGEKTGEKAKAALQDVSKSKDVRVFGSESGSAGALADLIIDSVRLPLDMPILWLTGPDRRPELPTKLAAASIPLHTFECYRVIPVVDEVALEAEAAAGTVLHVIVYSKHAFPSLRFLVQKQPELRVIAIGPTTASCLVAEGFPVAAVANKPTAASLSAAFKSLLPSRHDCPCSAPSQRE
ncbi:hypothetical protein DIPPA_33508 [Diplonema papillatum]|nr:hypothetical protein DIPPA_33508 [Diplonema papillatum]